MLSETVDFIYITIISVILLYINNHYNKTLKSIQAFNFLILSESIVLTFFFAKFPSFLSIIICFTSIYFIILQNRRDNPLFSHNELKSLFPKNIILLFKYFGFFLICCVILYEFFADGSFSESDFLVLCLSLILIFYDKIPLEYKNERDFFVVFLFLLSVLFVLPMVLYKLKYGYIGTKSDGFWYDGDVLTYYLLSKPLYFLLSFLGFNVSIDGSFISFEDLISQRFQTVRISESCAGLNSLKILISGLISYSAVEYRKLDSHFFTVVFLGCIIAYFANLIRMLIIVISGHYKGIEFMLFVHQYAGWIIFTLWVFLFWILMDRYYLYLLKHKA